MIAHQMYHLMTFNHAPGLYLAMAVPGIYSCWPTCPRQYYMWQSLVEIKPYSEAYFDCVTAFEAL